jgi:hypothetical protein
MGCRQLEDRSTGQGTRGWRSIHPKQVMPSDPTTLNGGFGVRPRWQPHPVVALLGSRQVLLGVLGVGPPGGGALSVQSPSQQAG